tara:strand:- start:99 stop:470 length:372 start_codon:yes stop_codon:yes gene_type:complete
MTDSQERVNIDDQYGLVNMDLVDDIVMAIPDDAWPQIKERFISMIVDQMPGPVLFSLTGEVEGYAKAETILTEFYEPDTQRIEIIIDAIKLLGDETTCYTLDLLGIVPQMEEDEIAEDLGALT